MPDDLTAFAAIVSFGTLALRNPVTSAPIFLGPTAGLDAATKRRAAWKSTSI